MLERFVLQNLDTHTGAHMLSHTLIFGGGNLLGFGRKTGTREGASPVKANSPHTHTHTHTHRCTYSGLYTRIRCIGKHCKCMFNSHKMRSDGWRYHARENERKS